MKELLSGIGIILTRDIKARIRANQVSPSSKSTGTTLVRSAKLVNSITFRTGDNTVLVGTNLRYARILHEGGIIRPRSAQYLAIPLTKEAAVRKPRDWDNTFIAKGVIFHKEGDKNIALYALKKQVTIPARPYMIVTQASRNSIESLLVSWLQKNINRSK